MKSQKESGREINSFISFLWWCAGATPSLLRELPTEWNKYAGIGASVLTTALLAAVSGGYALYSISASPSLAFIFGAVWGLVIFNLDRFIVSTLTKVDGTKPQLAAFTEQLIKALPRLIMAVIMGIVISMPLQLVLFQKEIQQQIYQGQSDPIEEIKQKIAVKAAEISNLNGRLEFESNRLNKLSDAYIAELEGRIGTGGTGKTGAGPVYRERLNQYRQAEEELRARKAEIDRELIQKTSELAILKNQEEKLNQVLQNSQSSLISKVNALSNLVKSDRRITLTYYSILFLIILLNASPVLVKLLTRRGPYDDMENFASRSSEGKLPLPDHEIDAELQRVFNQALDDSLLNPRQEKLKP
jgi:hypothetical protein